MVAGASRRRLGSYAAALVKCLCELEFILIDHVLRPRSSQVMYVDASNWERAMQLENKTDHIAILALMMVGILTKRLGETGQLDDATSRQLHSLVAGVRKHAKSAGLNDLQYLFDNIDRKLDAQTKSNPSSELPADY
jgi:hypothetical protein